MDKYSIGIDLGGTKILIGLVDKSTGKVVHYIKKKTKKEKWPQNILNKITDGIHELLEETNVTTGEIASIGIGTSGQVDRENGILVAAPNLDCYDLNLREKIKEYYNLPIFVGNDVETAAMGEITYGSAKGYEDIVCIFVGTGVGSSIIKDGKIIKGVTGTAGEFGHIVVDLNGRPCACGAHGCLEAYASRSAIEKRIEGGLKKGRESVILDYIENGKITSRMIKDSIERKDELVTECVDEAAEYLSGGIASLINLLNPKLIVLGGGLIDAVDYFYERTIKLAKAKALPIPASKTEFKKAALGDFSGVIGAALLER